MRHVISVLVENRFGVLARIAGLFSARGFNIDSLNVAETEDPTTSRMTIVVRGDERIMEQVGKQLHKLIDVIKVVDMTGSSYINRELALVKVACNPENRSEIMQIADIFQARVVDVGPKSLTVEATGDEEQVDALIWMLKPFGIKEMARTGAIALGREFRGEG